VMYEGKVVHEVMAADATAEGLGFYMTGGSHATAEIPEGGSGVSDA
jgi:hypothetical protein